MKRRIQFFFICLAATLILGQRAAADTPFVVDVWSTGDTPEGLPQSSVFSVTQTQDGYLWFGTLNGLVRFDGNTFTKFNVNNTPGLPDNRVVFLFEDRQNNLWVGTDNGGLCVIKDGVAHNFHIGGKAGKIIFASEDENDTVWFYTLGGKFFSAKDGKLDMQPPVFPAKFFYQILHLRVTGKSGVTWQLQNGRIEEFRDGKLERKFDNTPWQYEPNPQAYSLPNGVIATFLLDANVTAACEDPEGGLVVGTRGDGIYWFDARGGWHHLSMNEGLSGEFILSLCFDREGNLWVGTDGGGLDRVKRNIFNSPSGLSRGTALSAAEDAQGGIWVAFNSRGLTYSLTNSTREFRIGGKNNAWSVLVDERQQVWAGTSDEGLFHFVDGGFQPVLSARPLGSQIYALFQGRHGKLWVGGQNGLGSFDGQNWDFFSTSNAVRALADDANSNLWVGTGGGLYCLRAGRLNAVPSPGSDISCLLEDDSGALWVGTAEHGLSRLKNGHWTTFSAKEGLPGDIGYLLEDGQKNLWLGSYEGLLRVSFTNQANGAVKILATRAFGKSDGLPAQECSAGAQPAAFRARDGKLWFPTISGLASVRPAELKLNTNPPPVFIESVSVDGVKQEGSSLNPVRHAAVTLMPGDEQLEIHFTALNFSAPGRVRFKYQLEGHDKNPTDLGSIREVQLRAADLPPGQFLFRVTACNEDGIWNQTGATLAITVEPPFWRRPSFMITATLIFLGLLAGIVYLISTAKLKRQLRVLRQKEMIERERARIARDLHDQVGANLTQVALLGELAEADREQPDEIEQHAQQICATARETTRALDEIVWSLNVSNDTLEGLVNYACKYAQEYFALAGVSYRAELPSQLPLTPIPPEVRHNVFLAFKEAVNNVVKHAQADEARVKLQLEPGKFVLSVEDNGRGLGDLSEKQLRNGLKNMRKRLAEVQGAFEIVSGPNGGTVVKLTVPLKAGA